METITNWDFSVLDVISKLRCPVLNHIMHFFTILGDNGLIWVILSIVLIIIPKTRKIGIFALCSLTFEFIIGEFVLKNIIARERPFIQHDMIDTIIKHPKGYSCPSGHTSAAFATSFAIFLHNKKASIFAFITAFIIAFSRLYFQVHFPTDIIAGAIHGILSATIIYFVLSAIYKKRENKIKSNQNN